MTMKNTLLLMVLSSVFLQVSWAADKTASGDGILLPPPPPGPFMSAEGSMSGNEAGAQRSTTQERGWGEMPAIEPMSQDWPKDDFPAMGEMPAPPEFPEWNEKGMPPVPKDMGDFPAMGEMPAPPEFPEWNEKEMPPMPKDMGKYPAMGEMPPPPEFPEWNEQRMPPMPKGMGKYPAMGEMPPPPEFPGWNEQRMPPMPKGMGKMRPPPEFPEWGEREMPPMREYNPPVHRAYRARPPMRPRYKHPGFMPRGYPAVPQGSRNDGRHGPGSGASSYAE